MVKWEKSNQLFKSSLLFSPTDSAVYGHEFRKSTENEEKEMKRLKFTLSKQNCFRNGNKISFCAFYITFIILMMANVLTSDLHISLFVIIIMMIWCSYILFSFIFHLSSFISSLFLHSSTYVMYILLLSIQTDNIQVEWSKRNSSGWQK